MEPGFEITGRGVDAAALAEELARKVAERREAGVYSPEVEAALAERLPDEDGYGELPPLAALDYAATRAMSAWEVTTAYQVATDKPSLARPFIILAKRLARLWARIAVGPIQSEQTAFNRHVATALEAVRRQAEAGSREARASERDLCELAEAMTGESEGGELARMVLEAAPEQETLVLLGPAFDRLRRALAASGRPFLEVSPGGAWEAVESGSGTSSGPVTFISGLEEESVPALLVCELSFWLRPEALIGLLRRSYLALRPGGSILVAVRSFADAAGSPAPAWCAAPVVSRALEVAGFESMSRSDVPGGQGGYLLTAKRPGR